MITTKDVADTGRLSKAVLRFVADVTRFETPQSMLNALHGITSNALDLNVLGAMLLPIHFDDWDNVELDKTVFMHSSVSEGWWEEFFAHNRVTPGPSLIRAYVSFAPFTLSEILKDTQPIGVDRKGLELTQSHGIRDALTCPVGGRWIVAFWSKTVLAQRLSKEHRALIHMGASHLAMRLDQVLLHGAGGNVKHNPLTPRELSVVRLLSYGRRVKDIAIELQLGEETIRTHLKKIQAKLDTDTLSHTVAQAIRQRLIA